MKALHAGYVSGSVWKTIQDGKLSSELNWLDVVSHLSNFVINYDVGNDGTLSPELSILENIICRGLPTLPSIYIEKKLEKIVAISSVITSGKHNFGTILSELNDSSDETYQLLEMALCPVCLNATLESSPGFSVPEFGTGEERTDFDSKAEKKFWDGPLLNLMGAGGMQMVVRQRQLITIAEESEFTEQRTDFSVEFPGSLQGLSSRGIVFEVDGDSHRPTASQRSDSRRDEECKGAGWEETYRHRLWKGIDATTQINRAHNGIKRILDNPYLHRTNKNIQAPITLTDYGQRVNLLALFPFSVARIQRVILELIRGKVLSLNSKSWNLLVLDRDGFHGCGVTAARDLRLWLRRIFAIYCPGTRVPIIRIHEMSQEGKCKNPLKSYDALLDISVQLRYGATLPTPQSFDNFDGIPRVTIRSGYFKSEPYHTLSFADPLLPLIHGESLERELTFFLQNIFRKMAFREKQTEIIMRALRGESVIALLPTGAGKSITYQLPTLMQNGMSIIIAPIKSLMKDQDDNLKAIGISSTAFINSMNTGKERRLNTELMRKGCFKFVFISPERFVIQEFRDTLREIKNEDRVHFAFVVVDEAHCVSEWGHDFRTAYLRLGVNARKFCMTRLPELPILALTGTASFEVLDDVKVELGYERDADIQVRPSKMERTNLKYRVVSLEPEPVIPKSADSGKTSKIVGTAKLEQLPSILSSISENLCGDIFPLFVSNEIGSGLVFCPHKTWVHGAEDVRSVLQDKFESVRDRFGVYYGSSEEKSNDKAFDPIITQNDFKNNRLRLLACTKAFGMGIDKPDIRFTLHYNIPPSLESFYQEAGRAGRDGEQAQCWVLYAGTPIPGQAQSLDYSLNYWFHKNTFPGPEIEQAKAYEILARNRKPGTSARRELENFLIDETGVEYSVGNPKYHEQTQRHYINIKHPDLDGTRAYISVTSDGSISFGPKDVHAEYLTIRSIVLSWLKSNKPDEFPLVDWFAQSGPPINTPGIEELLFEGVATSICLSFENFEIERIANFFPISAMLQPVSTTFQCGFRF